MTEKIEVLIVGAGPAGSLAAELLARNGLQVALFDGRPPADAKACGGGVTAKALKAWPCLLNAVGRTINELELYSPSGKHLHLKLEEPFAVYSRIALDTYLRERARAAGARVFSEKIATRGIERTQTGWLLRGQSGASWAGNTLVGADGANSAVARMLVGPVAFLPGWVGYAWAFPRPDHISFGIATTQEAFAHKPLDELLWLFMSGYYRQQEDAKANLWTSRKADRERDDRIKEELISAAERYAARIPGLSHETWDARSACGESWALLGDAAGFADPVTGEGIYYALRSAELFANCYLGGQLLDYEKHWRLDFGRELKRASQMRRRFYGNFWGAPFTERMIEFARGHRGVKRVLGSLVAGEQGYTDLKKKLARSALRPI